MNGAAKREGGQRFPKTPFQKEQAGLQSDMQSPALAVLGASKA